MTTATGPPADPVDIRRALDLLIEPGAVVELRVPDAGRAGTVSGCYDDLDRLTQDASRLNHQHGMCYITLNPPNTALLAREANRAIEHA